MNAIVRLARSGAERLLDFALPPRCAGCAVIVEAVDGFCSDCWTSLEWLSGGCARCGHPLEATDAEQCGRCLANPPELDRIRAAVAYGELPRGLVLRLKYGRKVAIARTLARFMAPLGEAVDQDVLVVPVPLHPSRLRGRGFNQALLIADVLAAEWGATLERRLLVRKRKTVPLKGMSAAARAREMRGAFAVTDAARIKGRRIILIDDVLTTGSTAEACARALRRAGAGRIELVAWARVVRPSDAMR